MIVFIIQRLLSMIPIGIGIISLVGLLTFMVPGDPVDAILGDFASLEDKQSLRTQLGLDRPVHIQLGRYFAKTLRGDLGSSLITARSVGSLIAERWIPTAQLAFSSLLVAVMIALPLGILSAVFAGTILDLLAMAIALFGVALPNFWLGSMLILYFSLYLDWLPVSGNGSLAHFILPSLTMGTALAAVLCRMTRNSMLDCLGEDYIRTARAKGVNEFYVIVKHALRNAALPLVSILGLQFGVILTGAVITEVIFDWQGLGTLLLGAVKSRDYPVIQGCVLLFSFTYLLVNLGTDILYAWVDPRIKVSSHGR